MTEKETRDLFRKRVIELNHPKRKLSPMDLELLSSPLYSPRITLPLILQAISNLELDELINGHINNRGYFVLRTEEPKVFIDWKLTEEGKELTADEQDIEVIEKLLTLLQE